MSNEKPKYDFSAMGQAIKDARKSIGWTRERLAQEVNLAPRYIMSIENKGQHPSFQVFVELMTLFNISVDQFLFPDTGTEKSTRRFLGCLCGSFNPSSRQIRSTCLWLILRPSLRSMCVTFRYPTRP
ncbi:MAG: helix-turn-helix transcriptional regulator [Christensenellales bacterium]|jgi:transcriptional regulator with XRE-family HTH domain